jgi:predicted nicotinamide N-methyase
MTQEGKQVLDLAAASTGVMSIAAWLPPIASVFTIVWLGIRIYESDTVQKIINRK